jgi:hypothetical protein
MTVLRVESPDIPYHCEALVVLRERRLARKITKPTGRPCEVMQRVYYGSTAPKIAKAYPGSHPDEQHAYEPGWKRRVPMLVAQEAR